MRSFSPSNQLLAVALAVTLVLATSLAASDSADADHTHDVVWIQVGADDHLLNWDFKSTSSQASNESNWSPPAP